MHAPRRVSGIESAQSTSVDGAVAVGCLIAYGAMDLTLRSLGTTGSGITPWYPSAGLGFAALLIAGPVAAPVLFLERFALVFFAPPIATLTVGAALLQSAVHVGIYTLVAQILRQRRLLVAGMWDVGSAALLIGGVVGAALVSAAWSSVWLSSSHTWNPAIYWRDLAVFSAGDAIGGLIVVPLVLFVVLPYLRRRRAGSGGESAADLYIGSSDEIPRIQGWTLNSRRVEMWAASLAVAATIGVVWFWRPHQGALPGYDWVLCFLPLFWIAHRRGMRGAAITVAAYGAAWIGLSLWLGVPSSELASSQSLLLSLSLAGLLLGAARTASDEDASRYWGLVAAAAEGIWRLGPDGRTVHVNARMAAILGRPVEDIIGRRASEFIAPECLEAWTEARRERSAGRAGTYETRLARPDATRVSVVVTASPVRSVATREIVGSFAVVTDVSGLRESEAREQHAQQLLQAAFRAGRDALILFRASDEQIVDVNDVWCQMTGYTRDEVIGRSQKDLRLWGDPADSARLAELMREHGTVRNFEIAFNKHLANHRLERGYALLSAHPVTVDGVTYLLASGRDITGEKRAGESQSQLRRLEELGRLAGGVAHDFNNLLTVITAYAQLIRYNISPTDTGMLSDIGEIEQAVSRGASLTTRLLAFSRQQPVDVRPIDLNEILEKAKGMLLTVVGHTISIVVDPGVQLPSIMGDPGQVDQILLNLAVNARDAMPRGGAVRIRTRVLHAGPGEVAPLVGPDVLPGDYVELSVNDTGEGMDDATAQRVFEPFFTTKPAGFGTGLGLAVVAAIVRQARGAVRVDSTPGVGTTFFVYWPVSTMASVPSLEEPADYRPSAHSYGARILLVEDDDTVREIICRVLEDSGYRVVTSRDGRKALGCLRELEKADSLPAIIVCDIVMPVMGGLQFAEQVAADHPEIPILLMSGHARTDRAVTLPRNVIGSPLAKPFSVMELRRLVGEALEPRRV